MDVEEKYLESIQKQLSGIKRWVAVGAIGFLLIGVALLIFSVSMTYVMEMMVEKEFAQEEPSFGDEAADYFERGKRDELMDHVNYRLKTHPNDAAVYWHRSKAHILDENWEAALADIKRSHFLSPSWHGEYIKPMTEELLKKIKNAKK